MSDADAAQPSPAAAAENRQAQPSEEVKLPLLQWMSKRFGTTDLVNMDPLAVEQGTRQAAPRSRCAVRQFNVTFVGSAERFQYAVDNG